MIEYDHQSMILPGHRTFQPAPDLLNEFEKALYDRIDREFSSWLTVHGYTQQDTYGQDLEYRLAKATLLTSRGPIVVDIGVERGSFTQLALDAGATKVYAFECLPRHVQHLQKRFSGDQRVEIYAQAVSTKSGRAFFHIATDREGQELDYHHTLADLGDTDTIIRSERGIQVDTISLGDLLEEARLPSNIFFLKIDTDGHDLAVLSGIGSLRPRYILAEYWQTLPVTSGESVYTLGDLVLWARNHGYSQYAVIRRNGHLESVDWNSPWAEQGDWGNVLFIHDDAELTHVCPVVDELSQLAKRKNYDYTSRLVDECEAKEAFIRQAMNKIGIFEQQESLRQEAISCYF